MREESVCVSAVLPPTPVYILTVVGVSLIHLVISLTAVVTPNPSLLPSCRACVSAAVVSFVPVSSLLSPARPSYHYQCQYQHRHQLGHLRLHTYTSPVLLSYLDLPFTYHTSPLDPAPSTSHSLRTNLWEQTLLYYVLGQD